MQRDFKKKHEKRVLIPKTWNFSLKARRVHIILFVFLGNLLLSRLNITFDQQKFAEAKAYKKTGKFYCSTFRGHHDSIIKRLVKKHARKERYKKSINYNKRPKQTPLHRWNPFARSMLIYACEYITFL